MENIENLLLDLKESLEREIGGVRHDLEAVRKEMNAGFADVNQRFDTQAARLERQSGLWQTGARWSRRMDEWADKVDVSLEAKDREIAELRERIARLERKSA